MVKKYKKDIESLVGSSVTLGAGSMVLGAMGQGNVATQALGPGINMMGTVGAAMGAKSVMGMMNDFTKTGRPYKIRKGKVRGRMGRGY